MSAPSDPGHDTGQGTGPGTPPPPGAPSTQEIPVVPPPIVATQHPVPPPAAVPTARPRAIAEDPAPPTRPVQLADVAPDGAPRGSAPTGPVDFVPGLPGAGSAEPPPRRRVRMPGSVPDRSALSGVGLAALSLVLLQLGLAQDDGRLWSAVTLWSVFATAATVLGLVALGVRAAAPARVPAGTATRLAGAAVLALAVFWLLVVLPMVASDPGFLVTAALLALGGALWVGPARDR